MIPDIKQATRKMNEFMACHAVKLSSDTTAVCPSTIHIQETDLSYSFLSLKVPPPPCAVLLVNSCTKVLVEFVQHSSTRPLLYEFKINFEFVWHGSTRPLPYEFKIDFEFVREGSSRTVPYEFKIKKLFLGNSKTKTILKPSEPSAVS